MGPSRASLPARTGMTTTSSVSRVSQHIMLLPRGKIYLHHAGAKQWLRIRAMFKKRHVDNHLEYLQVSFFVLAFSDLFIFITGKENLG